MTANPIEVLDSTHQKLAKMKLDQFEVYLQKVQKNEYNAKDKKIESMFSAEDVGLSIRTIKNKRLGFSFTTSLEESAIDRAVANAAEISKNMPEDSYVGLESFKTEYPSIIHFDQRGIDTSVDKKIELAIEMEALCRQADSRVKELRSADLKEVISEVYLMDRDKNFISEKSTYFAAIVVCKAGTDTDGQMGHDYSLKRNFSDLDVKKVAYGAAERATELLGATPPRTMKCPAILRNNVATDLLNFLSSSFSAEEIDKGRSMLAKKEGKNIFSELVTIIDNGLCEQGIATAFDAEGVPSRITTVVDKGKMSGILCNPYYAKILSRTANSCSNRSIKSPPTIGTSNFYMEPGEVPFEKLVSEIKNGVVITQMMGLHTANPVTGDFSVGANGLLIENGKITKPASGFAIAGNILELGNSIVQIGSDLRFFGTTGAPSLLVNELSIGGK